MEAFPPFRVKTALASTLYWLWEFSVRFPEELSCPSTVTFPEELSCPFVCRSNSPIAFTIKVLPFAKVWVPMKFNLLFASQVRVPVPEAFNWAPLCTVALPEQSRLPDKVSVLAMLRTPADWTVKSLWAFAVMSPDEFSVPRRLKLEVA